MSTDDKLAVVSEEIEGVEALNEPVLVKPSVPYTTEFMKSMYRGVWPEVDRVIADKIRELKITAEPAKAVLETLKDTFDMSFAEGKFLSDDDVDRIIKNSADADWTIVDLTNILGDK